MSELALATSRREAKPGRISLSVSSVGCILACLEGLTIIGTRVATGIAYHAYVLGSDAGVEDYIGLGLLVAILYAGVLNAQGLYRPTRVFDQKPGRIQLLSSWALTFAIVLVLAFTLKISADLSRGAVISFFLTGALTTIYSRRLFCRWLEDLVKNGAVTGPRVAVVFDPGEVSDGGAVQNLRRHGIRIMAAFSTADGIAQAAERSSAYLRRNDVDEVILLVSWSDPARIGELMGRLRRLPVPVRLLADSTLARIVSHGVDHIGGTLTFELKRAPLSRFERAMKRGTDIVLAGSALLVLAPLMLFVA